MNQLTTINNFVLNHDLKTVHSQIEQLVRIALTTDNKLYDSPADRDELFLFKDDLTELINAAYQVAGK